MSYDAAVLELRELQEENARLRDEIERLRERVAELEAERNDAVASASTLTAFFDRFTALVSVDNGFKQEGADSINAAIAECWEVLKRYMDAHPEGDDLTRVVTAEDGVKMRHIATLLFTIEGFSDAVRKGRLVCIGCDHAFDNDEIEEHIAQCQKHPMGALRERVRALEEERDCMVKIAREAYKHWDADRDHKAGKYLAALGGTQGIRVDLDRLRTTTPGGTDA